MFFQDARPRLRKQKSQFHTLRVTGDNSPVSTTFHGDSDLNFVFKYSIIIGTVFVYNRCAFYLPAIYTGSTIISEKEGGVIERVVLSGILFVPSYSLIFQYKRDGRPSV